MEIVDLRSVEPERDRRSVLLTRIQTTGATRAPALGASMLHATSTSIRQSIRLTGIIAAAVAASIPIYMVIAWMVAPASESAGLGEAELRILSGVLAFLGVGNLVIAQVLFARGVSRAKTHSTAEQRIASYRTAVIIAFAVREGVAIYGLVLSFLSGDPRWASGFGAVALASMLMGWPKRSEMERLGAEVPPIY